MYQQSVRNNSTWGGSLRSDWDFDTLRSASVMGSFRSMARDLSAQGTIPDEDYYDDELVLEQSESINTDGATKGSDVPSMGALGILSNSAASHSTVVIRSAAAPNAKDVPSLETDTGSDEVPGFTEPGTPPQPPADANEPPPAYTGSVRSTGSARRASYAERHNITTGTIIGEADIGSGVDTIRPVKKVDTVRSIRLSEEFVGSLRKQSGSLSGSAPSSPVSPKGSGHKRAASQTANAGRTMITEVILPTLEKVCSAALLFISHLSHTHTGNKRRYGCTRNRVAQHGFAWLRRAA